MTRINSGIRLKLLTDEHLLAEHREIKRIPSVYKKRLDNGRGFKNLPTQFTLGTGHVNYFIDKAAYTLGRYMMLHEECKERGFDVEDYSKNWEVYNSNDNDFIYNDHIPSLKEYELMVERITERLLNTKKSYWHYYGKQITKEQAVKLLKTEFNQKIEI